MDRLTKRNPKGLAYLAGVKDDEQEIDCKSRNTVQCILDCFERCAAYEDATHTEDGTEILSVEEIAELAKAKQEGRLVVLPCNANLDDLFFADLRRKDAEKALENENAQLKAQLAEAVELLGLAEVDLQKDDMCEYCGKEERPGCDCECASCVKGCRCKNCRKASLWRWQHADRLEKLREALK